MAISITHAFVSGIADGADASVVRPSNWNAALVTSMATAMLLGRATAATGAFEEITLGTNLSFSGTTLNAASGSATWDTIGAAAGSATTANGTNNIVYNVAPTADSKIAWTFGETSAATNGTSTSGVPNQVLLKLTTLAASTQSPLSVYSRANHVFSVSPSTTQVMLALGTFGAPILASAASAGHGLSWDAGNGGWSFGNGVATRFVTFAGNGVLISPGSSTSPGLSDNSNGNTGLFIESGAMGICNNSSFEFARWSAGIYQVSKGSADAIGYAINIRKARGSQNAPSVITTGDVLSMQSSYAYLGATNTYRETSRYEVTSAGTISDATTGVGSIVTIYGKTQGTDVTVQPSLVITGGSTATIKFAGTGMFTANGSTIATIGATCPGNATVQEWLTVTDAAGTVRYIPCF